MFSHREADIYTRQPGLGVTLAARILAEFADDSTRFADAKARKNYAGTPPITRASGTRKIVLARYARNTRLGDAAQQWAFGLLKGSPGARAMSVALSDPATVAPQILRPGGTHPRGRSLCAVLAT